MTSLPENWKKIDADKYFTWLVTGMFFAAGLILILTADGTCDDGDSIMHYQFARWAIVHQKLFFDHWAKPLYVLIACPFAQFGLAGIKVFNLLISSATLILSFYIADALNIERKKIAPLLMALSPGLIVHALSGLTEPLFALILSISILLYLRNRIGLSVFIISFLPFVRSEGLIILGVFALLLVIENRWKILPFLSIGHITYSLAGYPIYGNFLWVFTRIPYAHLDSVYGKGNWSHFFVALPDIIGIPLYILLALGLVSFVVEFFKNFADVTRWRQWLLVYGCFLAYFIAHVIFWKFGIFNSMGLLRVLVGVLPLMALIQLKGINVRLQLVQNPEQRKWAMYVTIAAVIIFPFMPFESSWHYKRDFCLTTSQLADKEATDYMKNNFTGCDKAQYYYDANYISILMNIDFFDTTVSRRVWEVYERPPHGTAFVFWDNWYSNFNFRTGFDVPGNNPRFKLVKKFTLYDPWKYEKTTALFVTR